jgi:dolichol kinase
MPEPDKPRVELSRKVLHLSSSAIPLAYWLWLDRTMMLWLLGAGAVGMALGEALRQSTPSFRALWQRWVGYMVRACEADRVTGATYVVVGQLLSIWLFPKPIAVAVLLILSISDTAASLVGQRFGRWKIGGKTVEGSAAFFATAAAILAVALPPLGWKTLLAALMGTVAEALPTWRWGRLELNDNVLIPLVTGCALWYLGAA